MGIRDKLLWTWNASSHIGNAVYWFGPLLGLIVTAILEFLHETPLWLSITAGFISGTAVLLAIAIVKMLLLSPPKAVPGTKTASSPPAKGQIEPLDARKNTSKPPILPDITFNELLDRVMILREVQDDGTGEALKKIREIGREINDEISLRHLSVWGRTKGVLEPLPHEISKKGTGIGRDSAGNIVHLTQYVDPEGNRKNVEDYRFLKSEIDEVWPKP